MSVRLGLVQSEVVSNEFSERGKRNNLEKALRGIASAKKEGADIVCLQELFSLPYIGQKRVSSRFRLAEKIPGPMSNLLCSAAKEYGVVLIGGSIFEVDRSSYYNTSPVISQDGKLLGKYRKTFIPNDPYYKEQYYFSSGRGQYRVFDSDFGKIGVLICFDQWFPEAARAVARKDARVIFYPTAIGWTKKMRENEPSSDDDWINVQRMQAKINHVYVAAVNRAGKEENIDFWGGSFVADPLGRVIASCNNDDSVLVTSCDLDLISKSKEWKFLEIYKKYIRTEIS